MTADDSDSGDRSNDGANQAATVAFLEAKATHDGDKVERIDTHASHLFLTPDRVYKLKRAVKFPFLDYSTVAKRRSAAAAEVRLNRRTAPNIYLGIAAIKGQSDRLALGPVHEDPDPDADEATDVSDWVVVMRRFDGDQQLDRLLDAGKLTVELARGVADSVLMFHQEAEPRTDSGGVEAMRWIVDDNIAEMREMSAVFDVEAVDRLGEQSRTVLDSLAGMIDERRERGLVRHCHGDLHLGNICVIDGAPTLFDAVEFNESIAIIDVLYDLAYLLMDLDFHGRRDLANAVLNRYQDQAGEDRALALLPLFLSMRAAIRAKVLGQLALSSSDNAKRAKENGDRARAYLDAALGYLAPSPSRLVAVGGLSGTGKTTVARAIAPRIGPAPGALVIRSDQTRKALFGVSETDPLPSAAYEPRESERVYAAMCSRAAEALAAGHAVILDSVAAKVSERERFRLVARDAAVPFNGIWLIADPEILKRRVDARSGDASDADSAVVQHQLAYDLGPMDWTEVDAAGNPQTVAARVFRAIPDLVGGHD